MVERLIRIDPDGKGVTFLYDDKIPWKELGTMISSRASDVVFDEVSQKWFIKFPNEREVGNFDLRGDAIAEEVYILEKELINNVSDA